MPERLLEHASHLHRVAVFLAVVREGSVTRAARSLAVSKSAVSDHLRLLEQMCGLRLVERGARGVRLTEAGERFLPHARRLAEAWAGGLAELEAAKTEPAGTLRVTASHELGDRLVAPATRDFLRRHPRVRIEIELSDRIVDIVEERLDLAVRSGPMPDSNLVGVRIGTDVEIVVAAPEVARRLAHVGRPEQLFDEPWVLHSTPAQRALTHRCGDRVLLDLHGRARANSGPNVVALVQRGVGLGILPSGLAAPALRDGTLIRLLPEWTGRHFDIHAVYPSREHGPKVLRFVEALREVAASLDAFPLD
jgi:molybdate transport repressor ModE-like protein